MKILTLVFSLLTPLAAMAAIDSPMDNRKQCDEWETLVAKVAGNDSRKMQDQITSPQIIKAGGLDWYCCRPNDASGSNRWVGYSACRNFGGPMCACLQCPH
jgi:hypothetical protein